MTQSFKEFFKTAIDDKKINVVEIEKNYLDLLLSGWNTTDKYYNPPVSFDLLTTLLRMQPHHESAIFCKRDTSVQGYKPHAKCVFDQDELENFLAYSDMAAAMLDFIYTGNAYFEIIPFKGNKNKPSRLQHLHSRTMRPRKEEGHFCQVLRGRVTTEWTENIIHIKNPAPESSIYGLPDHLSIVPDLLLNREAKLVRLRFLHNGAHLGYIFILNKAFENEEGSDKSKEETALIEAFTSSKGIGNGTSLFLNFKGTENFKIDDNFKAIPIGMDLLKDDFNNVIDCTQEAILSAHRVPPEILAVITDSVKASPNLDKLIKLYNLNTVLPLQRMLKTGINRVLPQAYWIDFDPYQVQEDDHDLSSLRTQNKT